MKLTGIILFSGAIVLFLIWGRNIYYMQKYRTLLRKTENEFFIEYLKGIAIFIGIAISAGMVWG
jgi:hypothetical protein